MGILEPRQSLKWVHRYSYRHRSADMVVVELRSAASWLTKLHPTSEVMLNG
jgi:hypothetical protein